MELNKKSVSKNCAIKCQDCSISQLCIPVSLNAEEMGKLDDIIERKKPLHKGDDLFEAGQPLRSIYAVRSGS